MDLCLILSNLLENALEASRKTTAAQQQISLEIYQHSASILLIRVENNFDGTIKEKNHLFHSTKRKGLGIGTQSVRRMAEKNDGSCNFTYEDGVFTAKVMLRADLKKAMLSFFLLLLPRSCKEELSKPYPEVYFQAAYQYSSEHGIK